MAQGGMTGSYNERLAPERSQLLFLNSFPTPMGQIVFTSTSVAVSNLTTTGTPFGLVAGMCIHIQSNAPCFIGDGPTSDIARANALLVAKRLDAWEPYSPVLNYLNPNNTNPAANAEGQVAWFVAVVLQSAGSGILYVGRQK